MHYLILFGLVALVGLVPAFGPPSWIFAVFFYHKYKMPFGVTVALTALATTLGRLLLAAATRRLKNHLPKRFAESLAYAKETLGAKRRSVWVLIGLFVLSPLPSAQLFEAAGLLETNLLALGAAFFVGRLVSLSLYVSASRAVEPNIHRAWEAGLTSPWALAAEVLCLLAVVALLNLRWIVTKLKKR